MITVQIGNESRSLVDANESWVNQQINRRRHDGLAVCVRVTVKIGALDMILSSANCNSAGGGGREANAREKDVFDLWNKRGMYDVDFTGGNLIAFLKQLEHMVN